MFRSTDGLPQQPYGAAIMPSYLPVLAQRSGSSESVLCMYCMLQLANYLDLYLEYTMYIPCVVAFVIMYPINVH